MHKKIYPCGSKPASIYSLPKTHKMLFDSSDFSLRPILFSIGTYYYNLRKFLTELLDPLSEKSIVLKICLVFAKKYNKW